MFSAYHKSPLQSLIRNCQIVFGTTVELRDSNLQCGGFLQFDSEVMRLSQPPDNHYLNERMTAVSAF